MPKRYLKIILYLLYLLVISEVSLRIYLVHFASEPIFKKFGSRAMLETRYKQPRLQPHPLLFYINTPNYELGSNKHNSWGFRGEEVSIEKGKDRIRIVCIGGSTTYSDGVKDYKESYPYLVEKELLNQGINAEVINAGTPGYYSIQNLQNYYLKIHELQPDYVIIYHGINDLHTRLVWPPEYYKSDQSGSIVRAPYATRSIFRFLSVIRVSMVFFKFWESESSLNAMVKGTESNVSQLYYEQLRKGTYPEGLFRQVSADSIFKTNKPIYFQRNTEYLIKLMKEQGTQPILSTFVYSSEFPEEAPYLKAPTFQQALAEHNQIMIDLSKTYGLELIDLVKELLIEKDMFTDGIHFTLKGNKLRSKLISEKLINIINK